MKTILLIMLLTLTLVAYGQEKPGVIEKYEKHARAGNFLTRWYYDIVGTSTLWKEHLTLYDNHTFRYVYKGGECATFDKDEVGSWKITEGFLLLNDEQRYLIKDEKLYLPDTPVNQKVWVMKKVK